MSLREDVGRSEAVVEGADEERAEAGRAPGRPPAAVIAEPAPPEPAADAPSAKPRRPLRRAVLGLVLCAGLGGGAYAG